MENMCNLYALARNTLYNCIQVEFNTLSQKLRQTYERYKTLLYELNNSNAHVENYALGYGKTPQQNLGDTHAESYCVLSV